MTDYDIEFEILKKSWNRALDMRNFESLSKQSNMLRELVKLLDFTSTYLGKAYFIISNYKDALLKFSETNLFDKIKKSFTKNNLLYDVLRLYREEIYYMMGIYFKSFKDFQKLSKIDSTDA
ncbi:2438_t:CDS:2, partial [Racocetra fulgida]